ncbi:phenylacetaldoxime dehydratase family protein [Methylobacterium sp. E-045]|uniref:aliphatic aldoxime dehydratase n=1 Tax=Methylobacterium sp. E-045 TaxID=2836575 RepID=UPI001FBABA3E|nr:phenylacetaldoxime dehydratase family protein [Methylobacterium sp. E-045]MCJ2129758.1 phenylacetaldoxime dehydratase family protein [Methylobacterium sp. E-045]
MESSIDKHLVCPRRLSRRVADDYQPPFPLFVARAAEDLKQVVMAYFGIQYQGQDKKPAALAALRKIVDLFAGNDGPLSYDLTHHVDAYGYDNLIAVAYWRDPAAHCRWLRSTAVAGWWDSDERLADGIGYFREIVSPRAEQYETLFTHAQAEKYQGVGAIMDSASGEIQEHGYWGSMRDRIPISQTDWMSPSGDLEILSGDPRRGGRVTVRGHDNIALIRSGQDWREADGAERELYLSEMEPPLRQGMDFVRDNGPAIGCYSNRYVRNIDLDGNLMDETYDIGYWRSLAHLERWAESHPSHLKIFVTFFRVITGLQKLRLYHEVSVFDLSDQLYEYINCHSNTGMLRDASIQAMAA